MAAAARQLRRLDGVEAAVGGEDQKLRRRLGEERELETVVGLERQAGQVGDLAAQRADPALLRNHDRDRLALDQGFLDRGLVVRRRLGKAGAALAERRLRRRTCRAPRGSVRRSSSTAPSPSAADPRSISFPRAASLSSARISISSSRRKLRSRMLRMASAWTSVSLNVFISTGFGSSSVRMILMTLSRLR